jgi:hypothetical protein
VSHRLLVKDSIGEREMLLVDTLVVGRDPRCDITEADAQLSRRHAEFSESDQGVLVRDLNSRNGMLVNGRRVLEALLRPGDVVQVASLAVTYLRVAEPEAVSMPSAVPLRPARARRTADGQPVLPFRAAVEDDKTGLMSPDQVAVAVIASLGERRIVAETVSDAAGTVVGGSWPSDPAPGEVLQPPGPGFPAPPGTPEEAEPRADPATSALSDAPVVPINRVADPAWAASVTWHIATLAILAFLAGAVAVLPVKSAAAFGAIGTVAVFLAPLAGLLVAVGLGLFVSARVRRKMNEVLERAPRP